MTPQDFRNWRKFLDLTQGEAADVLGVTRRAVAKWEAGDAPIDKRTELAVRAYRDEHVMRHGVKGHTLLFVVSFFADSKHEPVDVCVVMATNRDSAIEMAVSVVGNENWESMQVRLATPAPFLELPHVVGRLSEFLRKRRGNRCEIEVA